MIPHENQDGWQRTSGRNANWGVGKVSVRWRTLRIRAGLGFSSQNSRTQSHRGTDSTTDAISSRTRSCPQCDWTTPWHRPKKHRLAGKAIIPPVTSCALAIREQVTNLVYTARLMRECLMSCPSCASLNLAEFPTEIMIHLGGLTHPTDPGVLVFPKVLVCLACGCSRLSIPEAELRPLREASARSAAA